MAFDMDCELPRKNLKSHLMQLATFGRIAVLLACFAAANISEARDRTISLPWIGQKTASECGRAVLASLAARRGEDIERLYRELPEPSDTARGYSILQMQKFGAKVGVNLAVVAPAGVVIAGECSETPAITTHFSRLARLVTSGNPIVVPVTSGAAGGHYLVLVGTENNNFILHNPASAGLTRISTSELASLMCNFGYVALVNR
jgi:ABC-type bacteriocin/lantibiotic exporter with double-glycine peptidase domain